MAGHKAPKFGRQPGEDPDHKDRVKEAIDDVSKQRQETQERNRREQPTHENKPSENQET